MQLNKYHAYFVDQLRAVAAEHGVVSDLLSLLDRSVYIEFPEKLDFVGNEDDLHWLRAAQIAAMFVAADKQAGADSPTKEE